MLLPLLLLASHTSAIPVAAPGPAASASRIHVWFNSDGDYSFGDRAKVYARSAETGYMVVLRADVDGQVRVLFPVDPQDNQQVMANKKYELKGRGGREAFVAEDTLGHGTVLAAFSSTPFHFNAFEKDGYWDPAALAAGQNRDDPETQLREIVQRMEAPTAHFDYDVASYVVAARPHYQREIYPVGYPYGWPNWWGYGFWRPIVVTEVVPRQHLIAGGRAHR